MLRVNDLHVYYGGAHVAFGVSMHIQPGQLVGLFGRNGSGKSSMFRAFMGLKPPRTTGEIVFKGRSVAGLVPHQIANQGLGWVPEDRKIFPNLTIRRNLQLGIKAARHQRKAGKQFGFDEAFGYFPKLYEMRDKLGNQMSGGEQQMLTIARTMMGNPDMVLLDEPTEGLAPNIARDVLNMILEIRKDFNITAVVVEQFSARLLAHLDYCYVMEKGEIIFEGLPQVLAGDEALQRRLVGVG
jgi:branched-chain amino acid transport system ATP-binding protein